MSTSDQSQAINELLLLSNENSYQAAPKNLKNDSLLKLRRVNHANALVFGFSSLLNSESMTDVTLVCNENKTIRAHRVILSIFSPYFKSIFESFSKNSCQNPVIVFKKLDLNELQTIIDFMYKGEVSVSEHKLQSVLQAAKELEVSGLESETFDVNDDQFNPDNVVALLTNSLTTSLNQDDKFKNDRLDDKRYSMNSSCNSLNSNAFESIDRDFLSVDNLSERLRENEVEKLMQDDATELNDDFHRQQKIRLEQILKQAHFNLNSTFRKSVEAAFLYRTDNLIEQNIDRKSKNSKDNLIPTSSASVSDDNNKVKNSSDLFDHFNIDLAPTSLASLRMNFDKQLKETLDKTGKFLVSLRRPGRPRKDSKRKETSSCPECFKKFVRPDVLKLHYRSVHLLERHPCNMCKKVFKWPGDLNKHKRKSCKGNMARDQM